LLSVCGWDEGGALLEETVPRFVVQRVFLHTDKAVAYGRLMGIMNVLRAEEYLKVTFAGLER